MDGQQVFSDEITAELLGTFTCKVCGQVGMVAWYREPTVFRKHDGRVEVVFPLACSCREGAFHRVNMSLLYFGNLLAESALRRPRRISAMKSIQTCEPRLLVESQAVVAGLVAAVAPSQTEPFHVSTIHNPGWESRAGNNS